MHFCAGLPIILVGCKKDLRRDPRVVDELRKTNQRPVTPEEVLVFHLTSYDSSSLFFFFQGMAVAQKLGGKHYHECSAKTGEGVREFFQYASRAALVTSNRKKSVHCIILLLQPGQHP